MKKTTQYGAVVMFAAALVLLDQLTKQWAISALADGSTKPLLGSFLSLRLLYNPGAAFSFGENTTWIFTILAVLACIAIPVVISKVQRFDQHLALGAVWAGALGNLIDRLVREPSFAQGHVVDFIAYNDWFVGNVADIELFVGAVVLILGELVLGSRESDEELERSSGENESPSSIEKFSEHDAEPHTTTIASDIVHKVPQRLMDSVDE